VRRPKGALRLLELLEDEVRCCRPLGAASFADLDRSYLHAAARRTFHTCSARFPAQDRRLSVLSAVIAGLDPESIRFCKYHLQKGRWTCGSPAGDAGDQNVEPGAEHLMA
jgi:hypothetical protein